MQVKARMIQAREAYYLFIYWGLSPQTPLIQGDTPPDPLIRARYFRKKHPQHPLQGAVVNPLVPSSLGLKIRLHTAPT